MARLNSLHANATSQMPEVNEWNGVGGPGDALIPSTSHTTTGKSPQNKGGSFVATDGLAAEFPQFQSFAGHNKPPFMLQLLGDYLVSISTTETITWRVGSSLLNAVADLAPLGGIGLLQPFKERPASSTHMVADSNSKNEEKDMPQDTHCEQSALPQPQEPPRAHPQPLNHPSQLPLQAAQETLCPIAAPCSSSEATVPPPSFSRGGGNELPRCATPNLASASAAGGSVAEAAPAAVSGNTEAPASAASPVVASPAQTKQTEEKAPALADAVRRGSQTGLCTVSPDLRGKLPESGESDKLGNQDAPNAEIFPGILEWCAHIEASLESGRLLAVSQQQQEPTTQLSSIADGAVARHVIGTAVADCRTGCLWRPLKGRLRCQLLYRDQKAGLLSLTAL